jgi:hypothetical protein
MRKLFASLIAATALLVGIPAHATTVKDFDAKPKAQQADLVAGFVDKMIGDIGQQNPELAQKIKTYFSRPAAGKMSPGIQRLFVELTALDDQARAGKADLDKIQVEAIIVWIVKQQFPPPQTTQK